MVDGYGEERQGEKWIFLNGLQKLTNVGPFSLTIFLAHCRILAS